MDTFWDKLSKRLSKLTRPVGNIHGCIAFIGEVPKKGGGYGVMKVKWPGSEQFKKEKAHRVAYMVAHKVTCDDIQRTDGNDMILECSHLCHLKTCVNKDHIILETHTSNQGRITCFQDNICHLGNHEAPSCLL